MRLQGRNSLVKDYTRGSLFRYLCLITFLVQLKLTSNQDIISSSLDSYNVARFSYDSSTAASRAQDALTNGWGNPGNAGASWEGVFTLPVCDVGWAASSDMERKEYILQGHDHEARPNWCGPICTGDLQTTKDFIKAANMENFQSPKYMCETPPGY